MQVAQAVQTTDTVVRAAAFDILESHNAMQRVTAAPNGPWIAGVYFARIGNDVVLFLEESGQTVRALRADPRVAFVVTDNDAMKDFLQGRGDVEELSSGDDAWVRAHLVAKVPWFQTYMPSRGVRVRMRELRVSSFARGWFPARQVAL